MTQQAVAILLDAGHNMSIEEQEKFSVYLSKLLNEYYYPKQLTITGRVMEGILVNYEEELKAK